MVRVRSESPWTSEEDALLIARWEAGRGFRELARLHGREADNIRRRVDELFPNRSQVHPLNS